MILQKSRKFYSQFITEVKEQGDNWNKNQHEPESRTSENHLFLKQNKSMSHTKVAPRQLRHGKIWDNLFEHPDLIQIFQSEYCISLNNFINPTDLTMYTWKVLVYI